MFSFSLSFFHVPSLSLLPSVFLSRHPSLALVEAVSSVSSILVALSFASPFSLSFASPFSLSLATPFSLSFASPFSHSFLCLLSLSCPPSLLWYLSVTFSCSRLYLLFRLSWLRAHFLSRSLPPLLSTRAMLSLPLSKSPHTSNREREREREREDMLPEREKENMLSSKRGRKRERERERESV